MPAPDNSVSFHDSRQEFYEFIPKNTSIEHFEEYLMPFLKTFECVPTRRSKPIYNEGDTGLWDIHLPNPDISGKNAFRMLCVIKKDTRKIILIRLFPRNELPYKGAGNKKGKQRWDRWIEEAKHTYFS